MLLNFHKTGLFLLSFVILPTQNLFMLAINRKLLCPEDFPVMENLLTVADTRDVFYTEINAALQKTLLYKWLEMFSRFYYNL